MTRHQQANSRTVVRAPFAASLAAAAAVYDPGLLLQLQAARLERAAGAPKQRSHDRSDAERGGSGLPTV